MLLKIRTKKLIKKSSTLDRTSIYKLACVRQEAGVSQRTRFSPTILLDINVERHYNKRDTWSQHPFIPVTETMTVPTVVLYLPSLC